MTTWLGLAIFAQFLFAIAILLDKHIVLHREHIGKPIVYAFYVSLLSGFVVVIAPFGLVSLPSLYVLALSFASAVTFLIAIYALYSALRIAFASDVAPAVGAISAVTTVVLASVWIDGDVAALHIIPIGFLVAGTALISHYHFTMRAFRYAIISGIGFGATVFLSKLIFNASNFYDGLFWTRMMNVVAALLLLLVPALRHVILKGGTHSSHSARFLVLGNKIIAGSASVLSAFAVSLGSVSIVNSLAGLQFVFVFGLTYVFSKWISGPSPRTSHVHAGWWHTAGGIALVVFGLASLYLT
ncbi:hypothetical protein HY969_01360 [Candidatus Kaiserbacteria bacterium]|nr:hypothetical protein [Candidatus Kaiserbacteria bacterium]